MKKFKFIISMILIFAIFSQQTLAGIRETLSGCDLALKNVFHDYDPDLKFWDRVLQRRVNGLLESLNPSEQKIFLNSIQNVEWKELSLAVKGQTNINSLNTDQQNKIYLNTAYRLDFETRGVLLHELVHVIQQLREGKERTDFEYWLGVEREAWGVQYDFFRELNAKFKDLRFTSSEIESLNDHLRFETTEAAAFSRDEYIKRHVDNTTLYQRSAHSQSLAHIGIEVSEHLDTLRRNRIYMGAILALTGLGATLSILSLLR